LGKINICASGIIIKKIGKPPLLWKGKGGSMKGGSIIMADLDHGGRGVEGGVGKQNRRKKVRGWYCRGFCMTWNEKKETQQHCIHSGNP
jgi:hypothetical protein